MAQEHTDQHSAEPQAAGPQPSSADKRRYADWLGWLILLLVFVAVNFFLHTYSRWVFLPYPRW